MDNRIWVALIGLALLILGAAAVVGKHGKEKSPIPTPGGGAGCVIRCARIFCPSVGGKTSGACVQKCSAMCSDSK